MGVKILILCTPLNTVKKFEEHSFSSNFMALQMLHFQDLEFKCRLTPGLIKTACQTWVGISKNMGSMESRWKIKTPILPFRPMGIRFGNTGSKNFVSGISKDSVMPLGVTVGVRSWISNGKVTGLIP
jgi:hypothetical protein